MKNLTIRVLLFITAIIGAAFSFWYLIDHQMYLPQLTYVGKYARFLNHGLFIIALVLLIFYKDCKLIFAINCAVCHI